MICEKMFLTFCQADNPRFSFIIYCYLIVESVYACRELSCRNLEGNGFSFLVIKMEIPDKTHLEFSITKVIYWNSEDVSSQRVCDTIT